MPAYEFTALFVVQLDMSVILKKPYNGVPIFIGAGGHTVVVGPVPYRIVLADMILFRLVFGGAPVLHSMATDISVQSQIPQPEPGVWFHVSCRFLFFPTIAGPRC